MEQIPHILPKTPKEIKAMNGYPISCLYPCPWQVIRGKRQLTRQRVHLPNKHSIAVYLSYQFHYPLHPFPFPHSPSCLFFEGKLVLMDGNNRKIDIPSGLPLQVIPFHSLDEENLKSLYFTVRWNPSDVLSTRSSRSSST